MRAPQFLVAFHCESAPREGRYRYTPAATPIGPPPPNPTSHCPPNLQPMSRHLPMLRKGSLSKHPARPPAVFGDFRISVVSGSRCGRHDSGRLAMRMWTIPQDALRNAARMQALAALAPLGACATGPPQALERTRARPFGAPPKWPTCDNANEDSHRTSKSASAPAHQARHTLLPRGDWCEHLVAPASTNRINACVRCLHHLTTGPVATGVPSAFGTHG